MRTELVNLLKKLEHFKPKLYFDFKGYSIGYGHFVGKNMSDWKGNASISEAEATQILLSDISKVEQQVKKYFNFTLNENQLAAITLWAFNFGSNRLKEATFVKLINQGSTNETEIESWWRQWNKAGGQYNKSLEQRRMMEVDIWFGREVRIPDYIGGGTLSLTDTTPSSSNSGNTDDEYLPPILPKKKFPILPVLAGVGIIGATGGYFYYKKRRGLQGFISDIPFWGKIAIAGGAALIAGATYAYANPSSLPQKPAILPVNNPSIMADKFKGSEYINRLHPAIREKAQELANALKNAGIPIFINHDGHYRTFAEQDALYAKRVKNKNGVWVRVTNAKGGYSNHNYGLAVDMIPVNGGWNAPSSVYKQMGEIGKALGWEWGGDFKSLYDPCHFQVFFGYTISQLRKKHENGQVDSNGYVLLDK